MQQPTVLYAVKQVELSIRAHLDQLLRPAAITVAQYTALTVLRSHDELSSAQLARRSFVTPQSMADMVEALAGRDLVRRRDDPANRRHRLLSLSEAGERLLADLDRPVRELEERMLERLSAPARGQLRDYLDDCRKSLA